MVDSSTEEWRISISLPLGKISILRSTERYQTSIERCPTGRSTRPCAGVCWSMCLSRETEQCQGKGTVGTIAMGWDENRVWLCPTIKRRFFYSNFSIQLDVYLYIFKRDNYELLLFNRTNCQCSFCNEKQSSLTMNGAHWSVNSGARRRAAIAASLFWFLIRSTWAWTSSRIVFLRKTRWSMLWKS